MCFRFLQKSWFPWKPNSGLVCFARICTQALRTQGLELRANSFPSKGYKHKKATLPAFHRGKKLGWNSWNWKTEIGFLSSGYQGNQFQQLNSGKETKGVVSFTHPLGKQKYYPTSKKGCHSLSDKVITQRFSHLVFELQDCGLGLNSHKKQTFRK